MAKKKIVKPTVVEKAIVVARLRGKYPQMFKPGWGKKLANKRTSDISNRLRNAGIDQATIDRMRGKKKSK